MSIHTPFVAALTAFLAIAAAATARGADVAPPVPYGPTPSAQQLAWQCMEIIAFTHFNMNTFTGREWGDGTEEPKQFDPADLDCRQWIDVLKDAGVKEVIMTAKHHDGFCLWPSQYTEHSVKNSPWKGGKGDVVAEFAAACRADGLKMGLYLSPWDRNSALYGDNDRYNTYYENELTELLTNYGDVSEVWFDGANGEGPNGKKQVYDWDAYQGIVNKLAPNSVTFGGHGTVRWAGNEGGQASEPNWCVASDARGTRWYPSECDVSIRPGWYYHPDQDTEVKSLEALLDIYYASVGRGAVLLLNVPPDKRGRIADPDVARLKEFHRALVQTFASDLAASKPVTATNVRGASPTFAAANVTGNRAGSYWATDDDVRQATVEVDLGSPARFNTVVLQEYISLGQRISAFTVEALENGVWTKIAAATTIGYKRILRFPSVTATKLRVRIDDAKACPTLSKVGLFNSPFGVPARVTSLLTGKSASASNVHGHETEYGADKAFDGDVSTRWATDDGTKQAWLEADMGHVEQIASVHISEFAPRIRKFEILYRAKPEDDWKVALAGTTVGKSYSAAFPPVAARYVRLNILDAADAPTIWEFAAYGPQAGIQALSPHSVFHSSSPISRRSTPPVQPNICCASSNSKMPKL